MRAILFSLIILIGSSHRLFAQAPSIDWQRCYGGTSTDVANCIKPTSDGGYIIAGSSSPYDGDFQNGQGSPGFAVLKITSDGTIQWHKTYGGRLGASGREIIATSDGGYIMTGYTSSADGDVTGHHGIDDKPDVWVVKMNSAGDLEWEKSYGGSGEDYGLSIQQTTDGGYIVAGSTNSDDGDIQDHQPMPNGPHDDVLILKLSATGKLLWEKCYGGSLEDGAFAVKQTPDGGYIVNAAAQSEDGDVNAADHFGFNYDYWVLKLSSTGVIEWQRSLGGYYDEYSEDVQLTKDGGYILSGRSASNDGEVSGNHFGADAMFDYWLVKLDGTGQVQWQKCFGGTDFDDGISVIPTSDGGYAAAGGAHSRDGDVTGHQAEFYSDYWVIKLNSAGALEWEKAMGSSGTDVCYSIAQTVDEGYIVAGYASANDRDVSGFHGGYADMWVVKLKPTPCIPTITVKAESDSICAGTTMTFNAVVTSEGSAPSYQWQINGKNAGANSPSFSATALTNGDTITCLLTSNARCASTDPVTSNAVVVSVFPPAYPGITITASKNNVCPGTEVTFSAAALNGGSSPLYHWQVNGAGAGDNGPTFTTATLRDGDRIRCLLTSSLSQPCPIKPQVLSNEIVIDVIQTVQPSLSIEASSVAVCAGDRVDFSVTAQPAGANAAYQWKINGQSVGTNTASYSTSTLTNSDQVWCDYKATYGSCASLPASSDTLLMQVFALPKLTIQPNDTTISAGSSLQLHALVTGTVSSFQWQPQDKLQDPLSLSPVTAPLVQSETYHLEIISEEGCKGDAEAHVAVQTAFFMPNAFTPNKDGKNDVYRIPPQVDADIKEFTIYNRWGEVVFTTTNRNKGWNGECKGKPVESGVFVYIIKAKGYKGLITYKGTVVVIR